MFCLFSAYTIKQNASEIILEIYSRTFEKGWFG